MELGPNFNKALALVSVIGASAVGTAYFANRSPVTETHRAKDCAIAPQGETGANNTDFTAYHFRLEGLDSRPLSTGYSGNTNSDSQGVEETNINTQISYSGDLGC